MKPSILIWVMILPYLSAGRGDRHKFKLLRPGHIYAPCTFEHDTRSRPATWCNIFRHDTASFAKRAAGINPRAAALFAESFERILQELELQSSLGEPGVNCLTLCRLREECLRAAGFADLFAGVKAEENTHALELLPAVLESMRCPGVLERSSPRQVLRRALMGVFAGNIFDLGAAASISIYDADGESKGAGAGSRGFMATRASLEESGDGRLIDFGSRDMDAFLDKATAVPVAAAAAAAAAADEGSDTGVDSETQQAAGDLPSPYRKILVFVDNCGADVVLGILPFALELLRLGNEDGLSPETKTRVILAANEVPAINDVTCGELKELLERVVNTAHPHRDSRTQKRAVVGSGGRAAGASRSDDGSLLEDGSSSSGGGGVVEGRRRHKDLKELSAAVLDGRLSVVSTGTDLPALDLRTVSTELQGCCEGVDLVVLEGMGRGIETNLECLLSCDCLNLGMVKHKEVADLLGGELFDCVCRFKPKAYTQGGFASLYQIQEATSSLQEVTSSDWIAILALNLFLPVTVVVSLFVVTTTLIVAVTTLIINGLNQRTRAHSNPQHWFLYHMGLY